MKKLLLIIAMIISFTGFSQTFQNEQEKEQKTKNEAHKEVLQEVGGILFAILVVAGIGILINYGMYKDQKKHISEEKDFQSVLSKVDHYLSIIEKIDALCEKAYTFKIEKVTNIDDLILPLIKTVPTEEQRSDSDNYKLINNWCDSFEKINGELL